jgi:hypothetical protein
MMTIKFHPDVLAAHAEFGGDLENMQRCYEWYDLKNIVDDLHQSLNKKDALICELLAALEQIAEAKYDGAPASRFMLIGWAERSLAKAKAAGYEI